MISSAYGAFSVLVAVHNRILRDGICCLLELQEDTELKGVASSAEAAVLQFAELKPRLTLLDLDLPGDGGLDAIQRIRQLDPEAWIIALVTDEADERSALALSLGASSVVGKHQIGKVPWQSPAGSGATPLKTGGSNTESIGILKALFSH